ASRGRGRRDEPRRSGSPLPQGPTRRMAAVRGGAVPSLRLRSSSAPGCLSDVQPVSVKRCRQNPPAGRSRKFKDAAASGGSTGNPLASKVYRESIPLPVDARVVDQGLQTE